MVLGSSFWCFPVKLHQKTAHEGCCFDSLSPCCRGEITVPPTPTSCCSGTQLGCVESWLCFLFQTMQLYVGVILTFLISIRGDGWSFCPFCCEIWLCLAHHPSTKGLACCPSPAFRDEIQAEIICAMKAWSWCVFLSVTSCQAQQTFSLGFHLKA